MHREGTETLIKYIFKKIKGFQLHFVYVLLIYLGF